MNIILFDNFKRNNLLPLTYTRPVAEIRVGILTIREKWEHFLKQKTSTLTENYLRTKYPIVEEADNIMINGSVCPNKELVEEILSLVPSGVLVRGDTIIAMHVESVELEKVDDENVEEVKVKETANDFLKINNTWDIFHLNGRAIEDDYALITKGRKSQPLPAGNVLSGDRIFIEKGAKIHGAMLNAQSGPIYIGKDAEIMEGSVIRGPFALCDHATVKMGAKIYGPTTIGPYCKVGGEINNSVFFGYSNKAHDGFMGQFGNCRMVQYRSRYQYFQPEKYL